ncbi:hypothetical protein [Maribacter sp. 2-571]|uniref:hypothetical protein n=1 Tax=Maribacter sp. 2-571 TaxID=3417569 RepID=UPI003D347B1C
METNANRIDIDFVSDSEFVARISEKSKTENEINLILEKTNDSLYAIYVHNKTTDSLKISSQNRHLFLIQEAKNQNGEWKPIEYWKYSRCENSYLSDKLEPNGILKTESKVYNGNFDTQIRFKLLNDNNVYYSNSTTGSVNLTQFDIPNDVTEYRTYKRIETLGSAEILKKVMFLEPNGLKEFIEKEDVYLKKMAELRKNNKN